MCHQGNCEMCGGSECISKHKSMDILFEKMKTTLIEIANLTSVNSRAVNLARGILSEIKEIENESEL